MMSYARARGGGGSPMAEGMGDVSARGVVDEEDSTRYCYPPG